MLIRKVLAILLVGIITTWGIPALADAKDAFKAVRKIDMVVETDVKFDDLSALVSDAKLELEIYGNDKNKDEQLYGLLKNALSIHEEALSIWRYQQNNRLQLATQFMRSNQLDPRLSARDEISLRNMTASIALAINNDTLPIIQKYELEGSIERQYGTQVILLKKVLSAAWEQAKTNTDAALPLLK